MNMFREVVNTDHDVLQTVLRLVLGIVFFAHGAQKLLGWFGGGGLNGTARVFETTYCQAGVCLKPGIVFASFIGSLELIGGICLLLGLFVPIFGFLFICDMTAAMIFRSNQLGWNGVYGMSANLLVLFIALTFLLLGAGRFSLWHAIRPKRGEPPVHAATTP